MMREELLKMLVKGVDLTILDTCTSTNEIAREKAVSGAPEFTTIIANEQSAGRGRMGRSFFSPGNTGLYLSMILRPHIKADKALEITTAAAVAAARVIGRATDTDVKIKWVNDIYSDMKKVCGILTEASVDAESGYLDYAVLGIGVNLFMPDGGFPEQIRDIASSVYKSGYDTNTKAKFTAALINELMGIYPDIGGNRFVDEYKSLSLMPGRDIYILSGDEKIPAKALSIGNDYSLSVMLADGSIRSLSSGDVSIKVI